ncbi:PQQ-dependent sugar dehydrogenase [Luteitalea sp.]|uniref:PQQ-dependent sugar dehydrogenase n=1 Tax=Luteitalea sp. TaxID=2004800 RepID=UPI0025C2514C|nr:PQQ-dependent sugar dehydrogenase [Luteitalea sp.]
MRRVMRVGVAGVAVALMGLGCAGATDETAAPGPAATAAQSGVPDCAPIETREPNVPDQQPTVAGQRRACAAPASPAFDVTVVARGLDKPWAVEPLPGGDLLVTEKPGRLRIISASGELGAPLQGVPKVDADGQGGLLDVALSPEFDRNRTIFWSYAEPRQGGNGTSVARGVLSQDRTRVESVRVIFRTQPTYDGDKHFGSRLAFGPDGMLYVTLGERSDAPMRPQAQQLTSHLGKVLRLTPDGVAAPDNPFGDKEGALPGIWSLGHRNVQAAAFDDQGRLWVVEHGTKGGDELNLVESGKNYGWPLVAFGEEYSSNPIEGAVTTREGFVDPVYYWDPVIAPSGAEFYTGSAFPGWRGNLFTGALKDKLLVRLVIENGKVTGEEHLLKDRGQRIRDVRQGPDGFLYVTTDESNGEVWRLSPKK